MRSIGKIDRLVIGAIGPPGKRTFYLEVAGPDVYEWFALEKEQVAALATHGLELIGETRGAPVDPGRPAAPAGDPTFRVGEIGLGAEGGDLLLLLSPTEEGEPVAFTVPADVFAAAARRALGVVAAGRPICRLCGLPVGPEGHACPGGNGDLRHR
ncbi:MAG: DUF3090 family protein [Acidimicrobiia bacterium]|nr:DUF3090 family protein [Acidimicrobiia bacterium]